jgi:GT2 family glycosyltransferase
VVFAGALELFHRFPRAALARRFRREDFALQLLTAYAQADLIITETEADRKLLLRENATLRVQSVSLPGPDCGRPAREKLLAAFGPAALDPARPGPAALTSIIILNHNGLEYSKRCIRSVIKYTRAPYELVLIDNGSRDGTAKHLGTVAGAQVILNQDNRGFAAGCNQGIRRARGEYLLLLNNDTVVTPGWLERMIACARSSRSIGLVGPRTNSIYGVQMLAPGPYRSLSDMIRWSRLRRLAYSGDWFEVRILTGFCLLLKRAVLDAVGLLDERFAWGPFEDCDYCLRATQAGFRLFCANDVFIHHYGSKGYAPGALMRYRKENREIFIKKWGRPMYELLLQSQMCSAIGFPTGH